MLVLSIFLMLPWQISGEAYVGLVPVSSGDSVTIYEQTGLAGTIVIHIHNFSVSVLMGSGGNFSGSPLEYYTATSNGTYLTIHCFRDRWLSGFAVGNNIVAAKLNGVTGYPDGIWASIIVNYTLGYNGTAESRFNALGPDTQIGPYAPTPETGLCTYMGDQHSELVLGFVLPTYTLTIHSNPTGIPFTANNESHTTSWSGTYIEGTSVSLVMPETYYNYVWSHWLEDGDPNRIKTVVMDTNITLTGWYDLVEKPEKPVGGKAIPIDKLIIEPEAQIPWIWLSTIILPMAATAVFVKLKKRKQ